MAYCDSDTTLYARSGVAVGTRNFGAIGAKSGCWRAGVAESVFAVQALAVFRVLFDFFRARLRVADGAVTQIAVKV